jgi:hypothetical protein
MAQKIIMRQLGEKKISVVYILTILVILFLFFVSFFKYRMKENALSLGTIIKVSVLKITCASTTRQRSYIWFNYNNKPEGAIIDSRNCNNFNVGDSTFLLHTDENDMFYLLPIEIEEEKWGMLLSGIIFIVLILNILFPKLLKFSQL